MANTQALAESALFFGGMLILVARQGGSALAVGVCLAVWAGALEVVQIWLPGRNANITEPLIPLLLGILLHRRRSERNNSASYDRPAATAASCVMPHVATPSAACARSQARHSARISYVSGTTAM